MQITDEQFIQGMKAAVEERGRDFLYPKGQPGWANYDLVREVYDDQCLYVRTDEDEAACLIGLAMNKAGVDLRLLRTQEGRSADIVLDFYGISKGVRYAAKTAQFKQDTGGTWGEALDVFEEGLR